MATRFYFSSTAYTFNTPSYDGSWNYTSEASRYTLSTSQGTGSPTAGTQIGAWSTTAGQKALDRQYVSLPLLAQTISGTFSCMLMTREYAGTDNVDRAWMAVKVIDSSGTVVATLFALGNATGASTTELVNNATHRTNTYANGASLSSYSCADGDRILVEIGYGNNTSATSPEASGKWGGAGTDATVGDNATTTDRIGWFEVSGNLTFQSGPIVDAISPDTGPETGGTNVTITGTGFASGCTAAIASAALTGVTFGSTSSITGVTPAGSFAGNGNVTVTNPNGLAGTATGAFAYDAPIEYQVWPTAIKALFIGGYSGGTWPDLIGHASTVDFTQGTAGLRPSVATTPAGNFVLDIDGSDDVLFGGGVGGIASGVATGFYRWCSFIFKPDTVTPDAGQALQIWRGDDDDFIQIVADSGKLSVTASDTTQAALSNATLITSDYTRVLILTNTVNNTKMYLGAGAASGMSLQATEGNGTWASRWASGGFYNSFEMFNHNNASRYNGRFGRLAFYQSTLPPTLPDIALLDAGLLAYIDGASGEYSMEAAQASFVASGLAAGLTAQRKISSDQASYIASFIDASFRVGKTMLANQASYVASFVDASLAKQSKILAAQASYVASFLDATLTKQSKLSANQASYVASFVDASLLKQPKLAAAQASYVASFVDASVRAQRKITAAQASYVASFTDASFARGYGFAANQASYVASFTSAAITKQSKLSANQASYVASFPSSTLLFGRRMTANQASYVASFTSTSLAKQSKILAAQASYVPSFTNAAILAQRKITAQQASFVPSFVNASLTKQSKILAGQASYVASFLSASLLAGRKLSANQASYVASFTSTSLAKQSKILAAQASYVASFLDANLSKVGGFQLSASTAAYTATILDATLRRTVRMSAGQASYVASFPSAGLNIGRKLTAQQASFVPSFLDVGLYAGRKLSANQASFVPSFTSTSLAKQSKILAAQASFVPSFLDAGLYAGRKITAQQASFVASGLNASFSRGLRIIADTQSYAVTVNDVALKRALIMPATATSYEVTVNPAILTTIQLFLQAETASFVTAWPDVSLVWGQYIPPRAMAIAVERAVPLVQIDILKSAPLVSIVTEKAVPLVVIDLQPTKPLVAIDLERAKPLVSIELGEQPMSLRVGAVAVLAIKTRILGVLENPDTLSLVVTSPSGVESTYVFGTHALIEYIPDESDPSKETGRFRARIPCTEASEPGSPWRFVWYTGGETVGVESGEFTVDPV